MFTATWPMHAGNASVNVHKSLITEVPSVIPQRERERERGNEIVVLPCSLSWNAPCFRSRVALVLLVFTLAARPVTYGGALARGHGGSPSLARYPGERKRKRYSRANTFNVCQGAPKPDPKARPATCSRDLCLRQIASGCRCGASSSPAKVLRSEEGQCRALTIVCRRHNVTILDRQHACNQGFIQRRVHKPALLCDNGEERPGVCNLRSLSLCDQF